MINKNTQLCISLSGIPGNFGTRFHNYLYQELGLDFIYKAFTTKDIEHAVKGVRALGIRGCAVSMPFKESCIPFIDEITSSAKAIESVNTIVNTQGYLTAYNTDYIAIEKLIAKYQLDSTACVVVQGSGGMAKAVVAAFKHSGFERVKIVARNMQAGRYLAQRYGYDYILPEHLEKYSADILVNVTPIGMAGTDVADTLAFSREKIEQASVVFDVVAQPADTPLIRYARELGKQVISGLEVIVLQAVEQFELYTGKRPNDDLVQKAAIFARENV